MLMLALLEFFNAREAPLNVNIFQNHLYNLIEKIEGLGDEALEISYFKSCHVTRFQPSVRNSRYPDLPPS